MEIHFFFMSVPFFIRSEILSLLHTWDIDGPASSQRLWPILRGKKTI